MFIASSLIASPGHPVSVLLNLRRFPGTAVSFVARAAQTAGYVHLLAGQAVTGELDLLHQARRIVLDDPACDDLVLKRQIDPPANQFLDVLQDLGNPGTREMGGIEEFVAVAIAFDNPHRFSGQAFQAVVFERIVLALDELDLAPHVGLAEQ